MKKSFLIILSLAVGFISFAPKANAQAVEQGNIIIDAYYGVPNLMTGIMKLQVEVVDPTLTELKVSSFGPMGVRASYMLSDFIGMGLEFYYAKSKISYTDTGIDSVGGTYTYEYSFASNRPRLVARCDIHLSDADIVDPYIGIGLGYSFSSTTLETTDPTVSITSYTFRKILPIAYRFAFGSRFFFTPFLGAHVEVALGGPLLTFGLSGKF